MGLVLSLTDNMSAGLRNATSNLQGFVNMVQNSTTTLATMESFSVIADTIGSAFESAGMKIMGTFSNITQKAISTGQTLFSAETQFSKLYEKFDETGKNIGKSGKDVVRDIENYAKTSIFEFEDMISSVTMLKANGIEAFDEITTSSGRTTQKLMDYAADLAAFNPQMVNMYGTGIQAAMGAISEYVSEGNAMSLKRGASLDILQILGEEKGATIEERSRQVADLLEKLNMVGMVSSMNGTAQQQLSNIDDVIFGLYRRLSDSGIYEKYTEMVGTVAKAIFELDESAKGGKSTFDKLIPSISNAIMTLLTPIEKLYNIGVFLAKKFIEFLGDNPAIAQAVTMFTALGGVFLLVSGVSIKLVGSLGQLAMSLFYLKQFLPSISLMFKNGLVGALASVKAGIWSLMTTLAPAILTMGVLFLIWKTNFLGLRDFVTNTWNNISNAFATAKQGVWGSLEDMSKAMNDFANSKDEFWGNFGLSLMKLMIVFKALGEMWNDYELSDDTFQKADQLGVLPLIEDIMMLKYRLEEFFSGLGEAFQNEVQYISESIVGIIDAIMPVAEGTFLESALTFIKDLLTAPAESNPETWRTIGEAIGKVLGVVATLGMGIFVLAKGFSFLSGVVAKVVSVFKAIISVGKWVLSIPSKIKGVFSAIKGVFSLLKNWGVFKAIGTVIRGVVSAFSSLAGPLAIVVGAFVGVYEVIDMFINGFDSVKAVIGGVATAIALVVAGLMGLITWPVALGIAIAYGFTVLGIWVRDHWEEIVAKVQEIWTGMCDWISQKGTELATWIDNALTSIGNFFSETWESIYNCVASIVAGICFAVVNGFLKVQSGIISTWYKITEWLSSTWNNIKETASQFGSALYTKISDTMTNIGNYVSEKWNYIKDTISNCINSAKEAVRSAIDKIKSFFNFEWKLPSIKLPHFSAEGEFSLNPPSTPTFNVDWYAKGGVFNQPSVIGVGEQGTEAVMPLEHNTGWIDILADKLDGRLSRTQLSDRISDEYMTPNVTNNNGGSTQNDNSVVFNAGAIQISVQNASEAETVRMAKKIMEYIKRQTQLEAMRCYT